MSVMHCAECGTAMTQSAVGSWTRCCNALGYWYTGQPLERDQWWPIWKTFGKYRLYVGANWPRNMKPVSPHSTVNSEV